MSSPTAIFNIGRNALFLAGDSMSSSRFIEKHVIASQKFISTHQQLADQPIQVQGWVNEDGCDFDSIKKFAGKFSRGKLVVNQSSLHSAAIPREAIRFAVLCHLKDHRSNHFGNKVFIVMAGYSSGISTKHALDVWYAIEAMLGIGDLCVYGAYLDDDLGDKIKITVTSIGVRP